MLAACLVYLTVVFVENPSTTLISISSTPQLLNVRSRAIQQSNQIGVTNNAIPYSIAGLLGDGQVVAVADTGIDETSCYFIDPNGQVPRSPLLQPVTVPSFRKVITYAGVEGSDFIDQVDGHGTHVAGTIAGDIYNSQLQTTGQFNGVAPNCKLVVLDLSSNGGESLSVCDATCLYTPGYSAGARLHTNSWGSNFVGNGYYFGADVDLFLYQNPDLAIFFAAGNEGSNGNSTITAEASSKNIIAVGASETTLDSDNIANIAWFSSQGPTYDGRIKPDIIAPGDAVMSAKSNGTETCLTISVIHTVQAIMVHLASSLRRPEPPWQVPPLQAQPLSSDNTSWTPPRSTGRRSAIRLTTTAKALNQVEYWSKPCCFIQDLRCGNIGMSTTIFSLLVLLLITSKVTVSSIYRLCFH